MIYVAGISIAVFLEFLLLGKKNKSLSDKLLAVWMFVIALHLSFFYLFHTGTIFSLPFLLGVDLPFPMLHGVFLYVYVAAVTDQMPTRRWLMILHGAPVAAMYLYLVGFFMLSADEKLFVYQNRGAGYESFNAIRTAAIALSGLAYVGWSIVLLKRHRRRVLNEFSYQHAIDLQWLRVLTWGMGAIWVLVLIGNEMMVFSGAAFFVFLIGFFGVRQRKIFAEHEVAPPAPTGGQGPEREKYARSGLSKEAAEALYASLIGLMTEEGVYKKSDLSVDDLATRLQVHPNHVSQIINEKEGRNFYDFVNHYRLEAFKQAVADPKNRHLRLLSIAFDCGFNSKSSFNRHFKKVTGKTPSEYFTEFSPQ